ncbi:MAG: urea transporter [Candidatus Cloacimonas sp.]|nr:urea transporter [Candidatus Cloacimonas sp.]
MPIFRAFGRVVLAIPHSYASILFSDSTLLGLMLLLVTLLSPIVGLTGLVSLLVSILFSRSMGFESWESKSGIASFNSLVIGMAIGYYYPMQMIVSAPAYYLGFVAIISIATLLLYLLISYLANTFFRLPAMSLPFSIVALLMWGYFARLGYLSNYPFDKIMLISKGPVLPEYWRMFFVSLGSVFFTPEVIAGILVGLALLLITRIGFVLALLGWTISYYLMILMGSVPGTGMFFPGFNGILIMLAVGGIYLLPGKTSWIVAGFSTVIGFVLIMMCSLTYYHYNAFTGFYTPIPVPVFAFPLNFVVLLVIFTLRLRIGVQKPVMNDYGVFNPEQALQVYQERHKRFSSLGIPQFALPLQGDWLVTQGHNGEVTHKLDWAYAWDFEIQDNKGKRFADDEAVLKDYYAFGKPVFSSAAGYVVKAMDGVEDNPVGQVNTRENWGNYLCISHGYGLYSFYAHLKKGSLQAKIGDYLKQGDRLGLVGNSGRAALPHLHFQVQLGPEAGSRTRLSHLINYKVQREQLQFVGSGIPLKDELISALVPEIHLQSIMGLQNLSEMELKVTCGTKQRTESWKVELDFWGNFRVLSSRKSELGFSVFNGVYNALSLKGNRNSALAAFALLISRLPYAEKQELHLTDEPALSVILNPGLRQLVLLFMPLFSIVKACTTSSIIVNKDLIDVHSEIHYRILGIKFKGLSGSVSINKYQSIEKLTLYKGKRLLLEAKGEKEL